jgi:hypothetical protein
MLFATETMETFVLLVLMAGQRNWETDKEEPFWEKAFPLGKVGLEGVHCFCLWLLFAHGMEVEAGVNIHLVP